MPKSIRVFFEAVPDGYHANFGTAIQKLSCKTPFARAAQQLPVHPGTFQSRHHRNLTSSCLKILVAYQHPVLFSRVAFYPPLVCSAPGLMQQCQSWCLEPADLETCSLSPATPPAMIECCRVVGNVKCPASGPCGHSG